MHSAEAEQRTYAVRILKTTRQEWIGLATLALPCMLYSTAVTVSSGLTADLLRIVDIYGLLIASVLIALAISSDRLGWLGLLIVGVAAFAIASGLGALGPGLKMAIGSRPLRIMAAANIAPCALFLLHVMFSDPRERALATSVWTFGFALGATIGPHLGGFMFDQFWSTPA